jgi:hypothetical protein
VEGELPPPEDGVEAAGAASCSPISFLELLSVNFFIKEII